MSEFENMNVVQGQMPMVQTGAYNCYWTYSFIGRSPFYAMVKADMSDFMQRFVRNWLWWADGWVPYFHSAEKGIPSTRLAQALVEKTARKIVGGRIMFKNAGKDETVEEVNPALAYVAKWAKEVDFDEVVKKAVNYATAGGTSLIKMTVDGEGNWCPEALRFDQFIPMLDHRGKVLACDTFIRCFTDLGVRGQKIEEGNSLSAYYVIEHRYFGDHKKIDGTCIENVPLCRYSIKKAAGSVTNGQFVTNDEAGEIEFRNLPSDIKRKIGRSFIGITFDREFVLPFRDLGCEILKFTKGVNGIPELPFGESLLAPIITHLEQWDYYNACAMTDMYLGRGRVLAPKAIQGANSGAYNAGIDEFMFTRFESVNPEEQKPIPVQFELRAEEWSEIRTRIIQDISITTGLNISTIASFVNDNTAARTAREISTEENETADFVNDKRAMFEAPLNRIIEMITEKAGFTDEVVIRWSGAGLTNRYALAEIINMGKQGNFISDYKAVQMFNYDDDTHQVQEEYERCIKDKEQGFDTSFGADFGGMNDEDERTSDFGTSD